MRHSLPTPSTRRGQGGFSLMELMIAVAIGLGLLTALISVFTSSSQSQTELSQSAQQIENGRYAMDALTQDAHHAGYFGRYFSTASGTTLPDPCLTGDAAALQSAMVFPVQGIRAANLSTAAALTGTTCATWLTSANLKAGSDILVVRRAGTSPLAVGDVATANDAYVQASNAAVEVQFGAGAAITSASKADGSTAATVTTRTGTAAEIRKYNVRIYFVAPCSIPSGGGSLCTGSSDDGGRPIPTLKRLELGVNSAGTRTFNIVPVAEGVETFKVEYGIDDSPNSANASTGLIGDGAPDRYVAAPSVAELTNAVTLRAWLVVRNPNPTAGHLDDKTYTVGTGLSTTTANDNYKRKAYSGELRLVNLSARRENP